MLNNIPDFAEVSGGEEGGQAALNCMRRWLYFLFFKEQKVLVLYGDIFPSVPSSLFSLFFKLNNLPSVSGMLFILQVASSAGVWGGGRGEISFLIRQCAQIW